ncbi:MAG TPA: acetylxylan esterase [Candidatus Baltobacteraceae bacterium]|jgi:dienelactone hydrolase|nr:acetylxylan esterase [Candidatus Baltobacteraceae bacterium]
MHDAAFTPDVPAFRRACLILFACAFATALQTLAATQTLDTLRSFPKIDTEAQWRERSRAIREQILVSSGLWPMPEKTPLHAEVFGKINRDGYSVERVSFQSCPGFYVAGNLYRPLGRGAGPFPAILNPHGHWEHGRLEDTEVCSNPGRCINFAKQGMIAFAYDMVGYNDTHFADSPRAANFSERHHSFASNNAVDLLWSVSLMGLQTWDSIRALDFLETLPDVDRTRMACTGESGGGTQTIILGAIDDRLAAQAPVVMVSHTMQGGCLCENMPGLRIRYSNMEIAAAAAPRPQILVSDTRDWTATTLEVEGPEIGRIYQLFQAPENLRYVRFDFPHNYNQTSREAVYQWFDRWLLHRGDQPVPELAFQKEPDQDLRVFPNGGLPPDAVSQADLVKYLINAHRERLGALNPINSQALENYRRIMGPAWQRTLQLDWPPEPVRTAVKSPVQRKDYASDRLEITRPGEDQTINAVRFSPLRPRSARKPIMIVLADADGAAPYVDDAGAPRGLAGLFLNEGFSVAVADEAGGNADADQTSLFFTTYNRTRLQERVRDLVSICQGVKETETNCRVALCGRGAAGFWCLLAAPAADAVVTDCGQTEISDDEALLAPDLFCPGIRNIDTFEGALVLAAPHPLLLHNAGAGFPADHLRSCYRTLHAENRLRLGTRRLADEEIVSWVGALRFSRE